MTTKEKKDLASKKYRTKKRAELNISSEEMEAIRKQKISDAVRKRYENGFKNATLSEEAKKRRKKIMSDKMTSYHANRTEEQRKETVKAANEANTGAKRSDESKKKMAESNLKYRSDNPEEIKERIEKVKITMINRSNNEKEKTKNKRSNSMNKAWKKQGNKLISDERSKTISEKLMGTKRSKESIAKQVKSITGRTLSDEHKKAIADANTSGGTVKSKWYDVAGIRCQGGSEKMFVERCIEEGKKVLGHPASIKTPHGYYRPDFIVDGKMVEVKSSWTYKQFKEKKQYEKVKWICENFVPVEIWVVDGKDKMEILSI